MFQKCHLCIFPKGFGVAPILHDSPTKQDIYPWETSWPIGITVWLLLNWSDWNIAAIEGNHLQFPLWRSMGLPLKTCHFLHSCSLSPDTHEMQWSLQFLQTFLFIFFVFRRQRYTKSEIENVSYSIWHWTDKAGNNSQCLQWNIRDTASYVGSIWVSFFLFTLSL